MKWPSGIQAAVEARQAQDSQRLQIGRQQALEGLLEAVAQARAQGDPATLISAWREIGRMLGFYAPERREVAAKSKWGSGLPDEERRRHLEVSVVKTNYTAPQAPVLLRREDDGYLTAVNGSTANRNPRLPLMVDLLRLITKPPLTLTARQIEQNLCGPGKPLQILADH